jgi:ATP-dependent Clp protease ATP-binding subunit ClpA
MFERFTDRARHVVVLAQEEARRMQHNYIGTEHLLLGLLAEPEGHAARVLQKFGITLDSTRAEVGAMVGLGKDKLSGHIPFTPRAKKTLELGLREAKALKHDYIGTEHLLLGIITEGEGAGVKVLRQHADPLTIRMAVLDRLAMGGDLGSAPSRRWLRRRGSTSAEHAQDESSAERAELAASPAADLTLSEASRLAGTGPVGSHHLLLAALTDPESAAARALTVLGVNLDQAKEALRTVDVIGTSDEPAEEAGRRQMVIAFTDDALTIEVRDRTSIEAARAALQALGDKAGKDGTIRGDLAEAASFTALWQALQDSLAAIARNTSAPAA